MKRVFNEIKSVTGVNSIFNAGQKLQFAKQANVQSNEKEKEGSSKSSKETSTGDKRNSNALYSKPPIEVPFRKLTAKDFVVGC